MQILVEVLDAFLLRLFILGMAINVDNFIIIDVGQ